MKRNVRIRLRIKVIPLHWWMCGILLLSIQVNAQKQKSTSSRNSSRPLTIPIGLDAYRMWDQMPIQRIGARAYMRSTYDREGGNEGVDASHFLFANEEDHNVSLDVKGKGVFYFFRANHWHGSPWHFIVDGKDNVVKETGTSDPIMRKKFLKKPSLFPEPLSRSLLPGPGAPPKEPI